MHKYAREVRQCKADDPTTYRVTAYIEAHRRGARVIAAGAATPNAASESKVDCIVRVVKSMKVMPPPVGVVVKVSFEL